VFTAHCYLDKTISDYSDLLRLFYVNKWYIAVAVIFFLCIMYFLHTAIFRIFWHGPRVLSWVNSAVDIEMDGQTLTDKQTDWYKIHQKSAVTNLTRSSATAKSTARPLCLVGVLYDISWGRICWWLINHLYVMGPKATAFREITQNIGHYAVQGHSRSPILVPVWYQVRFPISE